jgi:hypothetical protein
MERAHQVEFNSTRPAITPGVKPGVIQFVKFVNFVHALQGRRSGLT